MADTDVRQLAFEIEAFARMAGTNSMLFDDSTAFAMARTAILRRLRAAATDPSLVPEPPH